MITIKITAGIIQVRGRIPGLEDDAPLMNEIDMAARRLAAVGGWVVDTDTPLYTYRECIARNPRLSNQTVPV